jgi:hypothetical protein
MGMCPEDVFIHKEPYCKLVMKGTHIFRYNYERA